MALRLYTREEYEEELRHTVGLRPAGMQTRTLEAWLTPEGNTILLRVLPDGGLYPHYMVGKAAEQAALIDNAS